MSFTSRPAVITRIGRELGQFANTHEEIQVIESPLLGAGSGGIDPIAAGLALKAGFEDACETDATLFVYGQIATVMAQLRRCARDGVPQVAPGGQPSMLPIEIFFSYAHEDEELMDAVRRQLIVQERNGRILKWHDRRIPPGSRWRTHLDERLRRAQIILLFMSPHFIESRYCYEVECKIALERHEAGEATVIPIILRPCLWQETPLGALQALPRDARPISRWEDIDEVSLDVARGVISCVDDLILTP